MQILLPAALVTMSLTSACASTPTDHSVSSEGAVNMSPISSSSHYQCDSGEAITVSFPSTESAILDYKAESYSLQLANSGSGSRYVSDNFEWWTKGSGQGAEGTLLYHLPDGTSGEIIEQCLQT